VHFPDIEQNLEETVISAFYRMREIDGIEKKPATRELINWTRALLSDPDFRTRHLSKEKVPFLGVLFKKSQDYERANHFSQAGWWF
jgi:hypothetical protein